MLVIRIFTLVLAVSCKVNHASLFVYLQDFFHMPRAFSDTVLQVTLVIIKVKVCPTVAFTPLNQFLTAIQCLQIAGILISIHAFLNNRHDAILTYSIRTNIDTIQVTAATSQVETIVVTLPNYRLFFHITLLLFVRLGFDTQSLVLISSCLDFLTSIVLHIEQIEVLNRCFLFTRHLIFVSFQCRTRLSHHIDNPQRLYGTIVCNGHREMTRVRRPYTKHTTTLAIAKCIGIQHIARNTITKILHSIGS